MKILKAHIHDFDDSFYQTAFQYLSPARQQKAQRYRYSTDRMSCILGDYQLRGEVSEIMGCNLDEVVINHTEAGQPYIAQPSNSGFHISLSHSGGYVVSAIATSPVGIDIEMISEIEDAFLVHTLSQAEMNYVGSSVRRFFEIWTMKEAYLKCTGMGISGCGSLKSISVFTLPAGYHAKVIEVTDNYVISTCVYIL
jgi:4'-phosphopantetheinyl transferase